MLSRVDHIDLRVEKFEETIKLFTEMGFEIKRRTPSPRDSVEMALPGEHQVTFEIRLAERGKSMVHHIAFMADGTDIEKIKDAGCEFLTENAVIQDTGRTVSTFRDKNSLCWQLTD